jgi:predicted aspartyl protease
MKRTFLTLAWTSALLMALPAQGSQFGHAVAMEDSDRHTYYVSVSLGELSAQRFLVDTGSSHTAVDSETLARLQRAGQARYDGNLLGTMADGSQHRVPMYRISRLVIGESCVVNNVRAAVLPGADRNILGLSVLRRLAPFSLTTSPPVLRFSGCGELSAAAN